MNALHLPNIKIYQFVFQCGGRVLEVNVKWFEREEAGENGDKLVFRSKKSFESLVLVFENLRGDCFARSFANTCTEGALRQKNTI